MKRLNRAIIKMTGLFNKNGLNLEGYLNNISARVSGIGEKPGNVLEALERTAEALTIRLINNIVFKAYPQLWDMVEGGPKDIIKGEEVDFFLYGPELFRAFTSKIEKKYPFIYNFPKDRGIFIELADPTGIRIGTKSVHLFGIYNGYLLVINPDYDASQFSPMAFPAYFFNGIDLDSTKNEFEGIEGIKDKFKIMLTFLNNAIAYQDVAANYNKTEVAASDLKRVKDFNIKKQINRGFSLFKYQKPLKPRDSFGNKRALDDISKERKLSQEFTVSSHFRMQPFGPGRSKKKMILIQEYTKGLGLGQKTSVQVRI